MMTRASNPELERWMEEARRTPITVLLDHPGMPKLRGGIDKSGPCPRCRDGKDRFSVHTRKNVWNCRICQTGGDVIELCEILEGCDFFTACEILTRRPPPGRTAYESPEQREHREREVQDWRAKIAQDEARKAQEEADYRERERARCWEFWSKAQPIAGTAAEAYLAHRKLMRPERGLLRFAPRHPLFDRVGKGVKPVHVGPAMFAAIIGSDGRFAGLHATWIDLTTESGKALVPDRETGEFVPAKKVRGSQRGGRIELVRVKSPRRLFVGEGIETVLSVWTALELLNSPLLEGAAFWSSVNLLNLGGKAANSVGHPTLRKTDKRGRSYPTTVPSAVPDFSSDIMPVPDSVEELFLLGDGDSEPVFTRNALLRAALRHERPGRTIREAWADTGTDFNSMLRGQAA